MNKKLPLLALLCIFYTQAFPQTPVKIVPIGNSITHGDKSHFSYRYNLWSKLKSAGLSFDFVGTMHSNYGGNPPFPDASFDKDHEGHRGWRADQILASLPSWMKSYTPDMALIHIGTNDVFMGNATATTVEEIKGIIDAIRSDNPNATIFLAKIIGTTANVNNKIIELNDQITKIAAEKNKPNAQVIVVDQYSGFDPSVDTYDGKHPNATGEEKMAQKWFDAIKTYCAAHDTQSPSTAAGLSSSNISTTSFTVSWSPSKDFIGVSAYEIFKDGISSGTTNNTSFHFTSGVVAATTYTITVRSRDAAGNRSDLSDPLPVTTRPLDGTGTGLKAEYFNSISLSGIAALTRTDAQVNFNWKTSSPAPGLPNNFFSVRWTGSILSPVTGDYIFSTLSDDGVRLWVNNQLVIDNWTNHGPTTDNSPPIRLSGGVHYQLRMEYYENNGGAVAKLLWQYPRQAQHPVPQSKLFTETPREEENGSGLQAEYFNNTHLNGMPVTTRTDTQINFAFGYGSPGSGVNTNSFSARWTGKIEAPVSGEFTFTTLTDDGVRLWIDGHLVIDKWVNQQATYQHTHPVTLRSGTRYNIKMEYFEGGGSALAKLFWSYPGQTEQIIPQRYFYLPDAGNTQNPTIAALRETESIKMYPNPARNENVKINLYKNEAMHASLILLSRDQQTLWRIERQLSAGENEIEIPTSAMNSGLYFILIQTGKETLTRKLMIDN